MRNAEWAIDSAKKREATYEAAFKAIGGSYFTFTAGVVRAPPHEADRVWPGPGRKRSTRAQRLPHLSHPASSSH